MYKIDACHLLKMQTMQEDLKVTPEMPSYDKTPHTCVINVYSSTTGHKVINTKRGIRESGTLYSSSYYMRKHKWKYFWN